MATKITKTTTHTTVINNARFITLLSFPFDHLAGLVARLADAASLAALLRCVLIITLRTVSLANTPSVH
jgi:hypothetical protein